MKAWSYFELSELPGEIKQLHRIRSGNRLDCVNFYSPDNNLRGLTFFVNFKGQLYFSKTRPNLFVGADIRRQSSLALITSVKGKTYNLSSIYIDIPERSDMGYGNPSSQKMLGSGDKPNPLYAFRNDLYIFLMNEIRSRVELIIIPDQKNLWLSYYQRFLNGEFEEAVNWLRENSKPFFKYDL